MNKFRLGFLLFVVLFSQNSFSQENYLSGYIIKDKRDTIFGYIDYRNWKKSPQEVIFKDKETNKPNSYRPTEISEFSVQGEVYVSRIVNAENSSRETKRLKENSALTLRVDTAFLQTLFRGDKSLYYYIDPNGYENFYIQQGLRTELLMYKKFLQDFEGKKIMRENKKYVGQLTIYLSDCSSIREELKHSSYTQRSLTKIFQKYYDCSISKPDFQRDVEKTIIELGLTVGSSITSLNFKGDQYDYLQNASYTQSTNFSGGLFFDIVLPRNRRKWSINNELLFSSYNSSGHYEKIENEDRYRITSTELGYSYIKLNNMVRFKYPISKFFVYFNLGISNGLAITEKNHSKIRYRLYSDEKFKETKALEETRKYEQGLIFGTGLRYSKYSFEVRYEAGNGMSDYARLKSGVKRIYFLFSYRL